jgi:hypothetical protein
MIATATDILKALRVFLACGNYTISGKKKPGINRAKWDIQDI